MESNKKRFDYIDLLKLLAMLMVVSLHTGLWHTNFIESKSLGSFIQYCIRLVCEGVPIFILVNGFLIINKEFNLKSHIKKIFKILFLIVFWSLFSYLLINIIYKGNISFSNILNNTLLLNINNPFNGPLWFLQNLLMLYFIYPVINYVYQNNKKIFYYLFIIVTFFCFFGAFIQSVENLHLIKNVENIRIFLNSINPISNAIFIFYFMLGGVIKDKLDFFDKKKNRIIIIIVSIVTYILSLVFTLFIFKYRKVDFISNYLYGRITLAIIICGLFSIVYTYKSKNKFYNIIVQSIGSNTLGIFVLHYPIMLLLRKLDFFNMDNITSRIILFLLVFIVSYLLTLLIKKIPFVKKILTI